MQQKIPNPDEVAKLTVGGSDFQYFESVFVQLHFSESFDYFRFKIAEVPGAAQIDTMQDCTVTLGGQPAVTGIITERQVAYDAENHAVQISGKSNTWLAARASIMNVPPKGYDGQGFQDIAKQILQPFNLTPTFNGVDNSPFEQMQPNPGENVWSFLERIARQKKVICGVDQKGNFQFTGKLQSNNLGTLEEGKNILKMQFMKSIEGTYSEYHFRVQSKGDDQQNMKKAAAQGSQLLKGSLNKYSPILFPNENASYESAENDKRGQNEHDWAEGSVATAIITVQGWKSDGGSLWKPGGTVNVKSPMCPIPGVDMAIQNATFTQDNNSGTLTILECVPPQQLKGTSDYSFSPVAPGPAIQPPGGAQQ